MQHWNQAATWNKWLYCSFYYCHSTKDKAPNDTTFDRQFKDPLHKVSPSKTSNTTKTKSHLCSPPGFLALYHLKAEKQCQAHITPGTCSYTHILQHSFAELWSSTVLSADSNSTTWIFCDPHFCTRKEQPGCFCANPHSDPIFVCFLKSYQIILKHTNWSVKSICSNATENSLHHSYHL